ncbi:TPA: hypothetical protein ONB94_004150 [Enterobacter kobei]|nr:hypothetical protein [Enterobacter kobei]
MSIYSFVNNTWFVGIFGGIVSGLVTTWIIQKLFSGKTKKEYSLKVQATNKEIVYSLRSAISDNIHHELPVIKGLIAATARKNGVLAKDLYDTKQIAEDLVKEVMDSSFIPSSYKKEYCDNLMNLYLIDKNEDMVESEIEVHEKTSSFFDERLIGLVSASFGVLAASSTLILTFLEKNSSISENLISSFFYSPGGIFNKAINIVAPIFAATLLLATVFIIQYIINKKNKSVASVVNFQVYNKNFKKTNNENEKSDD